MGYWMMQIASEFFLPQEYTWKALEAMAAWTRGHPAGPILSIVQANTLVEAFHSLEWELTEDAAGNIIAIQYTGPASGSLRLLPTSFFEAIAPFVRNGSYLLIHREDFLDATHGEGFIEERVTFDGFHARFERSLRYSETEEHQAK